MLDLRKSRRIYKKSIEIIKKVQLRNGGCLATPEGERYPYIYPRDHAIITLGFISAGLYSNAKKALSFVLKCQQESGAFPQRIDKTGKDASYKPIQIDGTALILYAFYEYIKSTQDIRFARSRWQSLVKAADYLVSNFYEDKELIYTPNSIHEFPPTEQGLEIWANATSYAALKSMHNLCKILKIEDNQWKEHSIKIKKSMLKYMWNSRKKCFVKNIRIKESSSVLADTDASEYAVAEFNVLDDNDPRIKSTVKAIEKNLWNKQLGGICRYPKYEGRNNGGWGPWPHFTLMLARHYIRTHNKKKADKYINWVLNISYKNLLPEHISTVKEFEEYVQDFKEAGLLRKDRLIMIDNARKHPMFKKGIAYITLPLAWPHAEFIRTYNLYKETFHKK